MKFLKDLDIDQLKINSLLDYAEMKGINLEQELKNSLEQEVEKLYKKYVPKDVQALTDYKIKKANKAKQTPPTPPNPPKPIFPQV